MNERGRPTAPPSTGLLGRLFAQFRQPSGTLGRLAGFLMARVDADDRWMVDLLDVQPDDRVLEVGFGPGVAVALISARAIRGAVAGVDPSDVMVRQASRRNRAAVDAGQVVLRQGVVANLPYPDASFTKACTIHTLYFWPSIPAGFHELHRILVPGGLLVLAVRRQRPGAGRFDSSRYGFAPSQLQEVMDELKNVGFREVSTRQQEVGRETIAAILARR